MVDLKWKQRGLKESIHFQNVFPSKLKLKQWAWKNFSNLKMYFPQNENMFSNWNPLGQRCIAHVSAQFCQVVLKENGENALGGSGSLVAPVFRPKWAPILLRASNWSREIANTAKLQVEIQIQMHFRILHDTNTATGLPFKISSLKLVTRNCKG